MVHGVSKCASLPCDYVELAGKAAVLHLWVLHNKSVVTVSVCCCYKHGGHLVVVLHLYCAVLVVVFTVVLCCTGCALANEVSDMWLCSVVAGVLGMAVVDGPYQSPTDWCCLCCCQCPISLK